MYDRHPCLRGDDGKVGMTVTHDTLTPTFSWLSGKGSLTVDNPAFTP